MPERHFLQSPAASPDPTADTYILVTSTSSADKELFNTANTITRDVTVSGMTLEIDKDTSSNQIFGEFDGQNDIKSMTLAADRVVIRSAWTLHQTNVNIFARELVFEGDGKIITNPIEWAGAADASDGKLPGSNGQPGSPGGSVTLNIQTLTLPKNDAATRFDLSGGKGQAPGAGSSVKGADAPLWEGSYFYDDQDRQVSVADRIEKFDLNDFATFVQKNKIVAAKLQLVEPLNLAWGDYGLRDGFPAQSVLPTAGRAISAGRSGSGGNSGDLATLVTVSTASAVLTGGATPDAIVTSAGSTGGPNPVDVWQLAFVSLGEDDITTFDETNSMKVATLKTVPDGQAVTGGSGAPGSPGKILSLTATPAAFLHPAQVQTVLHYLEDAFLTGDRDTTILDQYLTALAAIGATNSDATTYQNVQSQMQSLKHRVASDLDYFFNPAGWVPELSLQANLAAYQNEVSSAMGALFLSYWTQKQAAKTTSAAATIKQSISQLDQQRQAAIDILNSAQKRLPGMIATLNDIVNNQVPAIKSELTTVYQDLQGQAKNDTDKKIISGVIQGLTFLTSVIPYGQPILGEFGNVLSNFDPYNGQTPQTETAGDDFTDKLTSVLNDGLQSGADLISSLAEKASSPDDAGKNASSVMSTLADIGPKAVSFIKSISSLAAPADVVEANLRQLEAHDPRYKSLTDKLRVLNKQKAKLTQDMSLTLQEISTARNSIVNCLLGTDTLHAQLDDTLAKLGHQALLFARQIGRDAQQRLNKYQYFLIKSYEYKVVGPFSGVNFDLDDVFREFETMLDGSSDGSLTDQNISDLVGGVYTANLKSITDKLIEDFEMVGVGSTVSLPIILSEAELAELNSGNAVTIDLQKMQQISPRTQNVRISDLNIAKMTAEGANEGDDTNLTVTVSHSGEGTIRFNGQLQAFRTMAVGSPNEPTGSAGIWGATLALGDPNATLQHITPSASDELLLQSLLSGSTKVDPAAAKELEQYEPPAIADLVVNRVIGGTANPKVMITALTLNVDLKFENAPADEVVLEVVDANGNRPSVTCSTGDPANPDDKNGQSDGIAPLYRIYPSGSSIKLEVPEAFGALNFVEWQDRNGTSVGRTPTLEVQLDANPDKLDPHGEMFFQSVYR